MDPFIGQIMMVGFNFAPDGWALCNGQLLAISQNQALFSLIGTTYGGDGINTFALPDLRGRVPVNFGQGPGLSFYNLGQHAGAENVTLTTAQIPAHNHTFSLSASSAAGDQTSPIGHFPADIMDTSGNLPANAISGYSATQNGVMAGGVSSTVGESQPHSNIQPYLCVNFIIALVGIYPTRP